jgi:hypothetical protein
LLFFSRPFLFRLDTPIFIPILIRSIVGRLFLVPNKTIYVREADSEVWEKVERLTGGSVSALITEALRRYVEEEELKEVSGMEPIKVEVAARQDSYWEDSRYDAEFVGRWLLYPDPDETRTGEPGFDAGAYFGVALTQRGNLVVYTRHVNDEFAPTLGVYGSFEKAEKGGEPSDILAMAAADIGADYVQKLDI